MGNSDAPQHPGYKKMKDTAWIKQGRKIADAGGRGILDNYNKVNVFDQNTQNSLNARNNEIYQRAFNDMNRLYNDTMNSYAARNYNRFGTLNATPAAYTTDEYQKDFQRQMNDLAYNKAMNYENLINNELNRRYNTLNMYQNMYGYGETPYQKDVANWNIENTNRDIDYKNQVAQAQARNSNNWFNALSSAIGNGASAFTRGFGSTMGTGLAGNILGGMQ